VVPGLRLVEELGCQGEAVIVSLRDRARRSVPGAGPAIPADAYREAARALYRALGYTVPEAIDCAAEVYADRRGFRAAVDEAYRRAERDTRERWAAWLHAEADRLGAGSDYSQGAAVGLRAAARMLAKDEKPLAANPPPPLRHPTSPEE
jgi:hypothetical protein